MALEIHQVLVLYSSYLLSNYALQSGLFPLPCSHLVKMFFRINIQCLRFTQFHIFFSRYNFYGIMFALFCRYIFPLIIFLRLCQFTQNISLILCASSASALSAFFAVLDNTWSFRYDVICHILL